MDIRDHFGVYGICYENDRLLCILKNAGPYKGRFDLPGGSQESGEGLTETLVREVFEETGFKVSDYDSPRMYDVMVKERGKHFMVHHIMAFYDIKIDHSIPQSKLPYTVKDGKNDSDSEIWIELKEINVDNSSPLVLKIKDEILGHVDLEKTLYYEWTTK